MKLPSNFCGHPAIGRLPAARRRGPRPEACDGRVRSGGEGGALRPLLARPGRGRTARDLERQLAQAERELRQKDSGAYRRQHTQFT